MITPDWFIVRSTVAEINKYTGRIDGLPPFEQPGWYLANCRENPFTGRKQCDYALLTCEKMGADGERWRLSVWYHDPREKMREIAAMPVIAGG
jgi:hypothetical protein